MSLSYPSPQQAIAVVGILVGLLLSLSPIPTFIDIALRLKSTGGYTVAPYVSSLMCGSLWLVYAILAGSAKTDLIPLNAVSVVIYSVYCGLFYAFSNDKGSVVRVYVMCGLILGIAVAIAVFTQSLQTVALMAIAANCVMFAAPLAVVQRVVATKSVRYMPFSISFFSFNCALVWATWAILANDYFVLVPNAIGTVFGLVQLILYGVYYGEKEIVREDEVQLSEPSHQSNIVPLTRLTEETPLKPAVEN